MKKISSAAGSQATSDVRIRYLRWSEIKCKLVWNSLVKDSRDEKGQETAVVIELDG